MVTVFLLAAGLAGLVFGGDLLVRGAVDVARRSGLSPLVIGLTLVGFGTSMPELVTSLQAAFVGSPGIAIGNVVGSNIANILLILGVAAVMGPVLIDRASFRRDGAVLAAASLGTLAVVLGGQLNRPMGTIFVLALLAYVSFTVIQGRREESPAGAAGEPDDGAPGPGGLLRDLAFVVGGLALTILGARFLVTGAINVAEALSVPETIIGLTIVAVGTSLPELVTTVAAARRGAADIAFGNVVGSNIFNMLFILGTTALIHPIDVPRSIATFDIWVMLGATALLILIAVLRPRMGRASGWLFLVAYAGYLAALSQMT